MSDGLDLDTKAYSLKNFIRRMDEVRERQAADYGPRRGVGHPEQKVSAPLVRDSDAILGEFVSIKIGFRLLEL
jgi:hypothetical protein